MRIDLYTKVVLTVIAACLLLITAKFIFAPTQAIAEKIKRVWVENNPLMVDISRDRLGPIHVYVTNPKDFFEKERESKEFPWQMTEPSELP